LGRFYQGDTPLNYSVQLIEVAIWIGLMFLYELVEFALLAGCFQVGHDHSDKRGVIWVLFGCFLIPGLPVVLIFDPLGRRDSRTGGSTGDMEPITLMTCDILL
jgi:hypothetical protein